tara:strand:+ start:901 stop:1047 length:147 start_codon:yes stop_codon:yes gene_type:complete
MKGAFRMFRNASFLLAQHGRQAMQFVGYDFASMMLDLQIVIRQKRHAV